MLHRFWRPAALTSLVLALAAVGGTALAKSKSAPSKATVTASGKLSSKFKINKSGQFTDGSHFRPGAGSRRRLRVHVDPANPGAKVSLQFKLRERFGWWTVARARLDKRSNARFSIRRRGPVRVRVVLTQSDGWTPLATTAARRFR